MAREVLIGISTLPGVEWRDQIRSLPNLGVTRVAAFPTSLEFGERAEMFRELEDHGIQVPFVHARHDFWPSEYRYWIARFGTKLFNVHATRLQRTYFSQRTLRSVCCVENAAGQLVSDDLAAYQGRMCVDVSHLENSRITDPRGFSQTLNVIKEANVVGNHLSGVRGRPAMTSLGLRFDHHTLEALSDLDYLKRYAHMPGIFGALIALELTNHPEEQLRLKERVEEILNERVDLHLPANLEAISTF